MLPQLLFRPGDNHLVADQGARQHAAARFEDQGKRRGPGKVGQASCLPSHKPGVPARRDVPSLRSGLVSVGRLESLPHDLGFGYGRTVQARTPGQRGYLAALHERDMVFALGPAGSGKTYLAVAMGVSLLIAGKVERIVLSRPAVEAGERLGFCPAT